ncbi:MAG: glycosyl transferase family 1 [Gammaproteobacteria bacterium]|nr:glycosyl transferase family 1 [Gammaproteobacteria bacterium]
MKYRTLIKNYFPWLVPVLKRHPKLINFALRLRYFQIRFVGRVSNFFAKLKYGKDGSMVLLMDKAIKSQYFDFDWYNAHQGNTYKNETEAFADFYRKSKFSNVNPSAFFDTERYFKANPDVYLNNINPLAHFLNNGKNEGRPISSVTHKWKPVAGETVNPDLEDFSSLRIALCLHVYYLEFLDYYRECLADFPAKVDVYISLGDKKHASKARELIEKLPSVGQFELRVVPNRGRNFGPMLVEFADQLKDYDLIGHLHSKKSLYSGRQQTQWADYLGEYLLYDKHVVRRVLSEFAVNKECGIYFPTSFWMMPDWVNHWLKNKPAAEKFINEWGLEHSGDFIAYPVGGMFWARPTALKQLFDKSYTYEDFPAEPLPNDGSELHALERCIGLLAEANGYKQLFYYPPLGQLTYDNTYIFSNYVNSQSEIQEKLQPFDIISFDIFDTLLRREFFVPDYAKFLLGEQLVKEGLIATPEEFVQLRNQCEFEVRKNKQFVGDVSIWETYELLASKLGKEKDKGVELAKLEFAYDLDQVSAKDEMVEIANELILMNKKVFIVTDTYYDYEQISLMLNKIGLTQGYQLFVSTDKGFRKDNGTMWAHLMAHIRSSSFVHVGDNAVADAQIPGDFGLQTLHVLNPIDKWQAAGWTNPFAGSKSLNKQQIMKWGPLVSAFGRFPFLGE